MKQIWTEDNGIKRLTLVGENNRENFYLDEAPITAIADEFGVKIGMELVTQSSDESEIIKTFDVNRRDESGFTTVRKQERV